jgi:ADP-ribose pyrophosphatase
MSGYNGKFLKVEEVPYNGKIYEIVEMKAAVCVLVLNNKKDKLLLVKQYRPVVKGFTLEIPAGMMDVEGEDPVSCILRELKEEANLNIDRNSVKLLASYCPIIGSVRHFTQMFVAVYDGKTENIAIKDDDVIERVWVSFNAFEKLVGFGEIIDAKTLLAYSLYRSKQQAKENKLNLVEDLEAYDEAIRIISGKKVCSVCNNEISGIHFVNKVNFMKVCEHCSKTLNIEPGKNNWKMNFN